MFARASATTVPASSVTAASPSVAGTTPRLESVGVITSSAARASAALPSTRTSTSAAIALGVAQLDPYWCGVVEGHDDVREGEAARDDQVLEGEARAHAARRRLCGGPTGRGEHEKERRRERERHGGRDQAERERVHHWILTRSSICVVMLAASGESATR
ncbi:MAG: hypothetical protein OHK0013_00090 [Sandaracinaceae bacterium]